MIITDAVELLRPGLPVNEM